MAKWYFTFLIDDETKADKYHVEEGTMDEARGKMLEKFGTDWGFQYNEEEWIVKKKDNPDMFNWECNVHGINPEKYEELTQAELFGLIEI